MTEYLTSREAMVRLNFTNLQAFNRAVHRYGIPHKYIGGRLAFVEARLEAWVATYRPRMRGLRRQYDRQSNQFAPRIQRTA